MNVRRKCTACGYVDSLHRCTYPNDECDQMLCRACRICILGSAHEDVVCAEHAQALRDATAGAVVTLTSSAWIRASGGQAGR